MAPMREVIRQAAAIPRLEEKVCLVSASSGRGWVIPKGVIDPGNSAAATALQEAFEEAGLIGILAPEPVGQYRYEKWGGICEVSVFLMQVTEVLEDWPERAVRRRRWLNVAEAPDWLGNDDLRALVRAALAEPVPAQP